MSILSWLDSLVLVDWIILALGLASLATLFIGVITENKKAGE